MRVPSLVVVEHLNVLSNVAMRRCPRGPELGLGVLACHRRQGRRYDVFPLQWPRRIEPDGLEREAFIERQRHTLEDAGAIAPRSDARYPKIR